MKKGEIAGIIINVISQLLIEKQTYQGAQSCHSKWQAKDKGDRTKDGLDWDREREGHQKWEANGEIEYKERNEMYWNENLWRSGVNHSFEIYIGFSLLG